MEVGRPTRLTIPVDEARDHVVGGADADLTLVEYGSYACEYCHAAHDEVRSLRDRFGGRLRYVFRHLPLADRSPIPRTSPHRRSLFSAPHSSPACSGCSSFFRGPDQLSKRMLAVRSSRERLALDDVEFITLPE